MPTVITLTEIPNAGDDLEDYVAALFQAAGYFVEKNVTERDPKDILELDLVATTYSGHAPVSILCEAKGGEWGWPDVFKVLGWMRYLRFDRGAVFVKTNSGKDVPRVAAKTAEFGISLVHFGDFSTAVQLFQDAGLGQIPTDDIIGTWRHSYSIERALLRVVLDGMKGTNPKTCAREIIAYHRLINDGVFFSESPVGRLHMLYDSYRDHPKIALASAVELGGGAYDAHTATKESPVLAEALLTGAHPLVQAAMYVEHRGRLAILKAAVEYACEFQEDLSPLDAEGVDWSRLLYAVLPASFREGVRWLREQPNFRLYALLWQQFLWGWGGFYLNDRESAEWAWMSTYSGVPEDEIPVALEAFDRFYPLPGGWLVTLGNTCVRQVKMVPTYFKGLGAHHRRQTYDLKNGFGDLKSSGYTANDLAKWNNSAVEFLGT